MRQQAGDIFQEKICRPFRFSDSGSFKEESSSCIVCKAEPFSSNREALAWKFRTDEVDVEGTGTFTLVLRQKKDKIASVAVEGNYSA